MVFRRVDAEGDEATAAAPPSRSSAPCWGGWESDDLASFDPVWRIDLSLHVFANGVLSLALLPVCTAEGAEFAAADASADGDGERPVDGEWPREGERVGVATAAATAVAAAAAAVAAESAAPRDAGESVAGVLAPPGRAACGSGAPGGIERMGVVRESSCMRSSGGGSEEDLLVYDPLLLKAKENARELPPLGAFTELPKKGDIFSGHERSLHKEVKSILQG